MPVIIANELTKIFGDKTVVNKVSFEIKRGEIFGFLGPNGSGKSTVIKMLCGLLVPNHGRGFIEEIDCTVEANKIRRSVGYLSQKFGLYTDLTVKENIEFYGRVYGLNDRLLKERMNELCERTNLFPYLNNKAETLSGGWKQRLGLTCALLHKPTVLFLDEPTAGIDPVARREVWDLLFDLSTDGMTMLVTTHYMDEAERCHKIGYIHSSNMIVTGTIDDLINLPNIQPQGYKRIMIDCENIMPIYKFLKSQSEFENITLFGRSIHCLVDDIYSLEQVSELLKKNFDCKNLFVKYSKQSLEDVFVSLTAEY